MQQWATPPARDNDSWRWEVGQHGDPSIRGGQLLHRRAYEQQGFVADSHTVDGAGLLRDNWSGASHHVALFLEDEAVGHLRLIDRSAGPLPSQLLWPHLEIPDSCWEVSALAVSREHARPFDSVERLYRQAFHYALSAGCTHWVGAIERPLVRLLRRRRGFPAYVVGGEVEITGTMNVPIFISFADCHADMRTGAMDPWFSPAELTEVYA